MLELAHAYQAISEMLHTIAKFAKVLAKHVLVLPPTVYFVDQMRQNKALLVFATKVSL